ncbi:MAG: FmdB family transcriptional regulator [Candidatus Eremiobacteraeota bacterium]|nr:FmdB family transcriptional regulator [Candidatus Eremiobacteraeota bacterium]
MPLYDYQCRTCSKVTEVRHGFREPHDGTCPHCGGEMARVFNPAGIVFKGSGFYITDSRKGGSSSDSSASPSSTPAAPAAPAAGGDSGSKKSESSAA